MCLLKPEPGRLAIAGKLFIKIPSFMAVGLLLLILPQLLLCIFPPAIAADQLFLEDPLSSFQPLAPERRRMELGTSYYSTDYWMGIRNLFRYQGQRSEILGWSITLPWIYCSYHEIGVSSRGNLRTGATVRLLGSESRLLRLAGDAWIPFANDLLFPLQVRRGMIRFTLLGDLTTERLKLRAGLGYRQEISSLGPERDEIWPQRYTLDCRLGVSLAETWGLILTAGLSASPDDITWGQMGGGLELRPFNLWRVELLADFMAATRQDLSHYDYRISLRLSRDLFSPDAADPDIDPDFTPAADQPPGAGGNPPPTPGSIPVSQPDSDPDAPEPAAKPTG
jgi:hypothetical protein